MNRFLQQHGASVMGMISGWDRLLFHGTLTSICHATGLAKFFNASGKLYREFKQFALASSESLKAGALRLAEQTGRPIQYVASPSVSKEQLAKQIAQQDGVEEGLICCLTAVEPCWSFVIARDPLRERIDFVRAYRKGLHVYQYHQHPIFGFMHVRLQTWLPFAQFIYLNGREWLSRQLDAAGIGYLRKENCFIHLDDVPAAQHLLDQQARFNWPVALNELSHTIAPTLPQVLAPYQVGYYWTIEQSEWASDFMFKSQQALSRLYPSLLRRGIESFASRDVLRFLGQRVPLHSRSSSKGIHGGDLRQVLSDLKQRPEGIRLKHRLGTNSLKMYNKQGSVLRIETTLNDVTELFSPRRRDDGSVVWKRMRKGVVDARQRARASDKANRRYSDALAVVNTPLTFQSLTQDLCHPVTWNNHSVRGLNLLGQPDAHLLQTIAQAQFLLQGLRNRDLQAALFAQPTDDPAEKRRRSAQVSRKLRILRAHGLIAKLPHTHRYLVTDKGRQVTAALIAARNADINKLSLAA